MARGQVRRTWVAVRATSPPGPLSMNGEGDLGVRLCFQTDYCFGLNSSGSSESSNSSMPSVLVISWALSKGFSLVVAREAARVRACVAASWTRCCRSEPDLRRLARTLGGLRFWGHRVGQ